MRDLMTVTGPISQQELGITLPHEHLLIDLSCLWHHPKDQQRECLVNANVSASIRGQLMSDPYHCRHNLVLDDVELAVKEVSLFKELGGSTILDLSTQTIGPYPEKLKEISERSGVNIVAATGFYTWRAHPPFIAEESISQLVSRMVRDLTDGFNGSSIKAGIIGEIGTSSPIHPDEKKVLQAAAEASKETGASLNIHLAIFAKEGHEVLNILEETGIDMGKVALSHLDELPDDDYRISLARRGCFIEFDCFGSEVYFDEDELREPSDAERINALLALVNAGFGKQILISQDVCTKMQLREYGGMGYDHILRTIIPRLKRFGLGVEEINDLLIRNVEDFLFRN